MTIINSCDLFTRAQPQSGLGKFLQFSLIRILIVLIYFLPLQVINLVADYLLGLLPASISEWIGYLETSLLLVLFIIAYRFYTNHVEKRPALEFSSDGFAGELGRGVLYGGGLMTAVVVLLLIFGFYRIGGFNSPLILVNGLFLFGMGSFIEELIFRLIIFKLVEEFFGSWVAIAAISLLFGVAHLTNPGANIYSAVAIFFEAGLLLSAAFMYTRRIWLIWGIHFGWNFFQSGIYGIPSSGITFNGLIAPDVTGPAWLTGGAFGVEMSVAAVILGLLLGIYFLKKAISRGQIVKPSWQRKKAAAAIAESSE
jgi:membrane protease YdiL (CAAX protease family)